ncbi:MULTISPECIES: RdgB/HAM1 family non-canonical purine NTP pyrophosphatase [unclassified Anaerobiospirillum]|uniref:RdgB/HAM1 family non-canonical purine NTP pyrophosphatase n=1 Tax=unclassified Anaerobiospirillum TaxID=2647410 RepID=UPI001FF4420E|nr:MULTISPECIES: RdgB/HAM1 family non-canonical purine NTP pyrophosphatase [unclassified Anaerobiospirillum]MCK0535818.1 RdgB/HAM1 family non-canonical purine NTP pyrophosphatase [Anaerobiospirillum sp. NML120511]MCK0540978.1 RdgB/HAM1 family non-canonical purine NTP pyrophosphatase [Anaerobiospirillum sp. NML02-A-032]
MVKEIVLASNNSGKAREFGDILSPLGIEVHLQKEFDIPEAEENGLSFIENALIKARNAAAHAHMPALADDSGLCVDALGGAPGIYSARYCGTWGNDKANNDKLLEALRDVPADKRTARYFVALAYVRSKDDPVPVVVTASWEGTIGMKPMGQNGFGYDPLFVVTGRNCTAAQIPHQIKNVISHRARALSLLVSELSRCNEI